MPGKRHDFLLYCVANLIILNEVNLCCGLIFVISFANDLKEAGLLVRMVFFQVQIAVAVT